MIILILLIPTARRSIAQDAEETPEVEVFRDSRGIPMVYIPDGDFHGGIEVDDAINQCLTLIKNEGFPPFDPKLICDKDFLLESRNEPIERDMQAFYMDQYEVSRGDYLACIKVDVCSSEPLEWVPNNLPDIDPIQYASYIDAAIYCAWREARLPNILEWEYAARGPKGLTYVWGNEFNGNLTNHCDVHCKVLGEGIASPSIWDDGYSEVGPVDAFKGDKSWAGIYNLAGNISEWTATMPRRDTPSYWDIRLVKGGSYDAYPYMTAAWFTQERSVGAGSANVGFRCVRTSKP